VVAILYTIASRYRAIERIVTAQNLKGRGLGA